MSDSVRPHGLQPTRLLCQWDFPGKSTGMGCHCLLQPQGHLDPSYKKLPPVMETGESSLFLWKKSVSKHRRPRIPHITAMENSPTFCFSGIMLNLSSGPSPTAIALNKVFFVCLTGIHWSFRALKFSWANLVRSTYPRIGCAQAGPLS